MNKAQILNNLVGHDVRVVDAQSVNTTLVEGALLKTRRGDFFVGWLIIKQDRISGIIENAIRYFW